MIRSLSDPAKQEPASEKRNKTSPSDCPVSQRDEKINVSHLRVQTRLGSGDRARKRSKAGGGLA